MSRQNPNDSLRVICGFLTRVVARPDIKLSARHLNVFLTCYIEEGPHTVRGLVITLGVSKTSVIRALDHLQGVGLVRRRTDQTDRRSIIIQRTPAGATLLWGMYKFVQEAQEAVSSKYRAAAE